MAEQFHHQTGYVCNANWDRKTDGSPDEYFGYVKVYFPHNNITSDWSPVAQLNAKDNKSSRPLDINTQVECLVSHSYDKVTVIGALYNDETQMDKDAGPDKCRDLFKDGTFFEYDRSTHTYKIDNKNHDVKIIFNGGQMHGMAKVKELTDKLNNLEKAFNAHLTKFNTHTHICATPGSASAVSAILDTATLTLTVQSDIENTNVQH
jgi:hypothetical protein